MFDTAKASQKQWAKTPLWKRADYLHKVAALLRQHAAPMARCLVTEIAKPAKDSMTEVIRSADLLDYTAEEGVRVLGEGQLLTSDSFPGTPRNKLCLVSKVPPAPKLQATVQQAPHCCRALHLRVETPLIHCRRPESVLPTQRHLCLGEPPHVRLMCMSSPACRRSGWRCTGGAAHVRIVIACDGQLPGLTCSGMPVFA
jgi:hypothetical protein